MKCVLSFLLGFLYNRKFSIAFQLTLYSKIRAKIQRIFTRIFQNLNSCFMFDKIMEKKYNNLRDNLSVTSPITYNIVRYVIIFKKFATGCPQTIK